MTAAGICSQGPSSRCLQRSSASCSPDSFFDPRSLLGSGRVTAAAGAGRRLLARETVAGLESLTTHQPQPPRGSPVAEPYGRPFMSYAATAARGKTNRHSSSPPLGSADGQRTGAGWRIWAAAQTRTRGPLHPTTAVAFGVKRQLAARLHPPRPPQNAPHDPFPPVFPALPPVSHRLRGIPR